ncbi:MAG TPA: polysaccharide deacetylase family protein [Solirubrobacteraceae bacterium]|nr:polysaccharide deacetylase family protein [Solirubrobacteraceae bacterium]
MSGIEASTTMPRVSGGEASAYAGIAPPLWLVGRGEPGAAGALLGNRSPAAAFLMYHSVADAGPPFLSVPADVFERQLAALRRLGWRSGTIADLRSLLAGERLDRPVAFLTFDDGFADNAQVALPIMLEYGMRPIVFVLPDHLADGAALAWPELAERQRRHPDVMRSMDWAGVERLVEAGAEIGSHAMTHRSLPTLGPEELRDELADSRRRLQQRLGRCDAVAYPFGHWSPAVAAAAAETGYSFAFTAPRDGQRAVHRFAIPRVAIDQRDDGARFRMKLSGLGRRVLHSPLLPPARRAARRAGWGVGVRRARVE